MHPAPWGCARQPRACGGSAGCGMHWQRWRAACCATAVRQAARLREGGWGRRAIGQASQVFLPGVPCSSVLRPLLHAARVAKALPLRCASMPSVVRCMCVVALAAHGVVCKVAALVCQQLDCARQCACFRPCPHLCALAYTARAACRQMWALCMCPTGCRTVRCLARCAE